jgi:hypothetical protein
VPHYLVEVRERADPKSLTRTRPTLWTHMTPEDMSYDVGHVFELEGRLLEVTHVEAGEAPFDQRLVCVPVVR